MRRRTPHSHHSGPIFVALLGLTLLASGCPDTSGSSGGPVDECQKTGQQCRLGDGQLGVCTKTVDAEFACEPQH